MVDTFQECSYFLDNIEAFRAYLQFNAKHPAAEVIGKGFADDLRLQRHSYINIGSCTARALPGVFEQSQQAVNKMTAA
ncbi:hypothetical protein D3C75_769040 [compost metagenome]